MMQMKEIVNMPKANISIVLFNNENEIQQRMDVLRPFFANEAISQVYIVDNNSSDKTVELVKDYAKDFSKIKVVELHENKGFGFGHNAAINQSSEDYHLIMNLDSTPLDENIVKKMINRMETDQKIGMISPLVKFPNGSIQLLTRNEPTVLDLALRFLGPKIAKRRQDAFVNKETGYKNRQRILNATGSFMFVRSSVLRTIQGFDERYFLYMEDTDLTKAINQVSEAWFEPEFVILHEWQRKNHSFKGSVQLIISMVKYFNKWGWKFF